MDGVAGAGKAKGMTDELTGVQGGVIGVIGVIGAPSAAGFECRPVFEAGNQKWNLEVVTLTNDMKSRGLSTNNNINTSLLRIILYLLKSTLRGIFLYSGQISLEGLFIPL